MNPNKIVIGLAVGLCWIFIVVAADRQDKQERIEQVMQTINRYQEKCKQGDQEACHQAIELLTRQ